MEIDGSGGGGGVYYSSYGGGGIVNLTAGDVVKLKTNASNSQEMKRLVMQIFQLNE